MTYLKDYYDSISPNDLWLPAFIQWTHFRFGLDPENIKMRKVWYRIRTKEALIKALKRYYPANAYYTPSKFLLARKLGKKEEANTFLFSDEVVIDIDRTNLMDAKQDALKLISYLKSIDKYPFLIVFSGRKGFHLHIDFDYISSNPLPSKRMKEFEERKKQFLEEVEKATGVEIDIQAGCNPLGLIRIPGTIHGKTGNLVEIIGEEDILSYTPKKIVDVVSVPAFKEYA